MNESSNANDQDAPKSSSTEDGGQQEPVISGSDYELAEPQLGVAEISEDVAESVDLEAAAAEAARVEHEAELAAQGVSAPFTDAFEVPSAEEAATADEPVDWDSAHTVMRTDFTKPPVATNPWSQAADSVPDVPAAPDVPAVPGEPEIPVAPVVPGAPEVPGAPVVPESPESPAPPESPAGPEAPQAPIAPAEPSAPEVPPAPTTAPHAGNDHGWRRPETPWQQSATPWQPKAGQWQSPAQIARGHEETAAAAALAAQSPAAEQATVPIESQPDSAPTSALPQADTAGPAPQQPSTQAPYGAPAPTGQPNYGGPAPFGQAAASGQPPYGAPAQQGPPQYGAPQQGAPQQGAPQYGAPQQGAPQQGVPNWGAPAQFGAPGIPPVPGSGAPQGPNGPGYPGGPQGPGPLVPGFPNGPAGPGGGMSPSAKKKLFIILGAVVIGLGLLAFFIWLLVGFILGNVKNLDPNPAPVATSESRPLESPGAEPSAEQSAEPSDAAKGGPDDGLILEALSPLDWLEGDCLRNFKDQSTEADVVLCSSAHNAQLVGTYYFEDKADYPGLEALKAKAAEVCDGVSFTSDAGAISTLKQTTAYPSETTWNDKDDRRVDCMVHDTRDGNPLTTDLIQ